MVQLIYSYIRAFKRYIQELLVSSVYKKHNKNISVKRQVEWIHLYNWMYHLISESALKGYKEAPAALIITSNFSMCLWRCLFRVTWDWKILSQIRQVRISAWCNVKCTRNSCFNKNICLHTEHLIGFCTGSFVTSPIVPNWKFFLLTKINN